MELPTNEVFMSPREDTSSVYKYLSDSKFLTPGQVIRIQNQIRSQYDCRSRKYFNMDYLNRVMANVGMLLEAHTLTPYSTGFSPGQRVDVWLTALFHRICLGQRSIDNAERAGSMTKIMLDEIHYPDSQRIATLVTMVDLRHFPHSETSYSGIIPNIIRDAVLAEWAMFENNRFQQWILDMRTDLCLSKPALAKLLENIVLKPVEVGRIEFATPVGKDLFRERLMTVFERVSHYLETTKHSKKNPKSI